MGRVPAGLHFISLGQDLCVCPGTPGRDLFTEGGGVTIDHQFGGEVQLLEQGVGILVVAHIEQKWASLPTTTGDPLLFADPSISAQWTGASTRKPPGVRELLFTSSSTPLSAAARTRAG